MADEEYIIALETADILKASSSTEAMKKANEMAKKNTGVKVNMYQKMPHSYLASVEVKSV